MGGVVVGGGGGVSGWCGGGRGGVSGWCGGGRGGGKWVVWWWERGVNGWCGGGRGVREISGELKGRKSTPSRRGKFVGGATGRG